MAHIRTVAGESISGAAHNAAAAAAAVPVSNGSNWLIRTDTLTRLTPEVTSEHEG